MLAILFMLQKTKFKFNISRQKKAKKLSKVEEKKPEPLLCRTCLGTQDLVSIFSEENEKKRSDDLFMATGLEIKINDGLSQKICSQCIDTMNAALQFRKTCRKAEKTLLSMLSGHKTKKKYTTRLQKKIKKIKSKKECYDDDNDEKMKCEEYDDDLNNDVGFNDDGLNDFQNDNYDYNNDYVKEECNDEKHVKLKPGPRKRRGDGVAPGSYKCAKCNKDFKMKTTYKAHMRFHTNYCICESCGKRCRNYNQLQEHKRARHGLGRIHKCAYCEYSSATKEALTIHERRHTGERPYVCDHCGATFHRRSNLVQHIAIHLKENNFQCDMCPKRLKSKKFLQIHKHNAHTGRRYGYLCSICDHRFEKPNKVRAHTRRVHGVPDEQQGPIVRVAL